MPNNLIMNTKMDNKKIIQQTQQWLTDVIVGLNLCPFAKRVVLIDSIRLVVSGSLTVEQLLEDFVTEIGILKSTDTEELETTLLIIPTVLSKFEDYNQFLDLIDDVLLQFDWQGVFQVASFHPNYCFAGADADDSENLTNRSPYPILHILREDSVAKAVANYPSIDDIPKQNIKRVEKLSSQQKLKLFPYLFAADN
jgi:hypothetical protein